MAGLEAGEESIEGRKPGWEPSLFPIFNSPNFGRQNFFGALRSRCLAARGDLRKIELCTRKHIRRAGGGMTAFHRGRIKCLSEFAKPATS